MGEPQTVFEVVLPWVLERMTPGTTRIVGINGPQGCGKSTLCRALVTEFKSQGRQACSISIDDFYLTRLQQEALGLKYPDNPFLQARGYPGTHDVALGAQVLGKLKTRATPVSIPRYDKSAYEGRGDRYSQETWELLDTPQDIVFFEGWMLGFIPTDDPLNHPGLRVPNALLAGYKRWHDLLDGFVQLRAKEHEYVVDWRMEAEQAMRASGRPGMSDAEVYDYATSFLPAYHQYVPPLDDAPLVADTLRIQIGKDRAAEPLHFEGT